MAAQRIYKYCLAVISLLVLSACVDPGSFERRVLSQSEIKYASGIPLTNFSIAGLTILNSRGDVANDEDIHSAVSEFPDLSPIIDKFNHVTHVIETALGNFEIYVDRHLLMVISEKYHVWSIIYPQPAYDFELVVVSPSTDDDPESQTGCALTFVSKNKSLTFIFDLTRPTRENQQEQHGGPA